jgi:hypothetical protein
MHGELLSALCRACGHRYRWEDPLGDRPPARAAASRELRPDIVWFGEMPYEMDRIYRALAEADLFVSIGTSGAVYPAAGFVMEARANGARTLELNLEPSEGTHWFDEARHGKAGDLVPRGLGRRGARRRRPRSPRLGGLGRVQVHEGRSETVSVDRGAMEHRLGDRCLRGDGGTRGDREQGAPLGKSAAPGEEQGQATGR